MCPECYVESRACSSKCVAVTSNQFLNHTMLLMQLAQVKQVSGDTIFVLSFK